MVALGNAWWMTPRYDLSAAQFDAIIKAANAGGVAAAASPPVGADPAIARQDDGAGPSTAGPSTASPIGPSAPTAEERKSWGSPASIMDGVREARIVIWSTSQQRKLSQEECPLPAELANFLDEHPDCEVYSGQEANRTMEARIVMWSTTRQRKLPKEECPLPAELANFLDDNSDCELYTGQVASPRSPGAIEADEHNEAMHGAVRRKLSRVRPRALPY